MNHVLEIFKSDYSLDITFINNNEIILVTTFFAPRLIVKDLRFTTLKIK